jgi:RTX calcium-binding nonapeptide repeat (4 copies)
MRMRTLAILATAASALALASAPAQAARVRIDGATLKVDNGNVEDNTFSLTLSGSTFVVQDTTRDVNAAAGCTQVNARRADCPAAGVTSIDASLGTGDDKLNMTSLALPSVIDGGTGDDVLTGGTGPDRIEAGLGRDRLDGKGGNDVLNGQGGEDQFLAGPGADAFDGGDNFITLNAQVVGALLLGAGAGTEPPGDRLDYGGFTTTGVSVTLDDVANDGQPGEGDNVKEIEIIEGTVFTDTLSGNGFFNILIGTPSGAGLRRDANVHDTLDAKGGPDIVDARGGTSDNVVCGSGSAADGAILDLVDPVTTDCEDVQQAAVGQHPIVDIRKARVRGGKAVVTLVCPKGGRPTCSGKLTVSAGSKRLGQARYRIRHGHKHVVAVRLGGGPRHGLKVIAGGKDREGEGTTTLFRVR